MFSIKLADHIFSIDNKYDYVKGMCEKYDVGDIPGVPISVTDDEIQREGTGNSSAAYLESLAVYRKIAEYLINDSILLFHGSAVAVDNEAYLFAAPSGTGKSTHARLWREFFGERAVMINDDKPLIKITDSGAFVYGTPWNGKHKLSTNTSAPLKAICILEQSETNSIEEASKSDAWTALIKQSYRPSDPIAMQKTLSLVERLGNSVKVYLLKCNTEPEAAQIAYSGMNERNEQK